MPNGSRDLWDVIMQISATGAAQDEQLKAAAAKLGHQPEMGATSGNAKQTEGVIDEQMGKTTMDAKAILHTKAMEAAGKEIEQRQWDDPREAANARNLGVSAATTPKAPLDTNRHNTGPKNVALPRPVHTTPHAVKAAGAASKAVSAVRGAAARAGNKARTMAGDAARKGRSAMTRAGMTARAHPGKAMAAAGAAGAAGGFMAGRRKKANEELRLADYVELLREGDEAVKTASEQIPRAVLARLVKQARQARSTGYNIGLGMLREAAGIEPQAASA